jgi:hypothetical protein
VGPSGSRPLHSRYFALQLMPKPLIITAIIIIIITNIIETFVAVFAFKEPRFVIIDSLSIRVFVAVSSSHELLL